MTRSKPAALPALPAWPGLPPDAAAALRAVGECWLKARTDQVRDTLETVAAAAALRDPAALAELQRQWLARTVDGLNAEMAAYQAQMTALARATLPGMAAKRPRRG